ncbi:peptide ABC transporter permease, partial [filamentous cyanobacterium CCP5]
MGTDASQPAGQRIAVRTTTTGAWRQIWGRIGQDPALMGAIALLTLIVLAILVGPWLYPLSPTEIDFAQATQPPSLTHPLGTNDLGQDQLARLLVGGRVS